MLRETTANIQEGGLAASSSTVPDEHFVEQASSFVQQVFEIIDRSETDRRAMKSLLDFVQKRRMVNDSDVLRRFELPDTSVDQEDRPTEAANHAKRLSVKRRARRITVSTRR